MRNETGTFNFPASLHSTIIARGTGLPASHYRLPTMAMTKVRATRLGPRNLADAADGWAAGAEALAGGQRNPDGDIPT